MQFHLFIFAFVAFDFGVRSKKKKKKKKTIAETDVKELSTYVFFQDFYGFRSYIQDFSLS